MYTLTTSTQGWVKVSLLFIVSMFYNAFVEGFSSYCTSCSLAGICALHAGTSSGSGDGSVPLSPFQANDRWITTATDGFVGNVFGTPRTLTWGLVADGTNINGNIGEPASPSNLISRLDGIYGSGPGGSDLTLRPWFTHFETSFERWEELSGLTFDYESNDGGAAIDASTTPRGSLGVYADHRIGGHTIDGNSGTLAYNFFPDHADMVIDTGDNFFNNINNNSIRLQNVLMHEIGHGIGISHLESNNSSQLMEPFISTAFRGPQLDDILAVQRNYGDALEKNGGNDSAATATSFGRLAENDSVTRGEDGADPNTISMSQTDFISIDGSSDTDYFHFTVSQPSAADIILKGVGRTYNEGPQGGTQSPLDTENLNLLEFDLFEGPTGSSLLAEGVPEVIPNGRNDPIRLNEERILGVALLPGIDYFLRINGTQNNVQLYQLDLNLTSVTIPEPSAFLLFALGLGVAGLRNRS